MDLSQKMVLVKSRDAQALPQDAVQPVAHVILAGVAAKKKGTKARRPIKRAVMLRKEAGAVQLRESKRIEALLQLSLPLIKT